MNCLHEHIEWTEPHRGKCLDCGVKIVPLDELLPKEVTPTDQTG